MEPEKWPKAADSPLLNYNNNFFFFHQFSTKKITIFFTSPSFCYLLIKIFNSSSGRSHKHTVQ